MFDNVVLDVVMPKLSGSAWKVLTFIIRKTDGFHKDEDAISYSQIRKGTGIASETTIRNALLELQGQAAIKVNGAIVSWVRDEDMPELIFSTEGRGRKDANIYSLNPDCEIYC